MGTPLQLPYEDGAALDAAEALVVRLLGDEHAYSCVLRTKQGVTYTARFSTRHGYNTVRLPFNTFRPVVMDDPPLQPGGRRVLGLVGGRGLGRIDGWVKLAAPLLASRLYAACAPPAQHGRSGTVH